MQEGETEKESPGMLPPAITAEAPTACGGGGTPAPSAVRPRRETTGSGYGSALPKPKKGSAVKNPAARETAATSATTAIVEELEPLKQRVTGDVWGPCQMDHG